MKRWTSVAICLLLLLLCGCDSKGSVNNVQLTAEQEACIDLFVQHRDDWKESVVYGTSYPVNRVHIAELNDGITILTVANVMPGTGAMEGTEIFVGTQGYVVKEDVFTPVSSIHKDWNVDGIDVDLNELSDSELRKILQESYKKYLSKK